MKDPSKTNQELIEKNALLKQRIQELEQSDSERKRATEALRESEEYFKEIIKNSSDIILILDKLGTITYASSSIERFLGYVPDEVIGKRTLDLIVSDDKPRAIVDFGRALLTKEVLIPNVFRVRHKNGTELLLEGIGNNLLDNPIVAGFVMNVRDITDRKKMEEEKRILEERLQRAEKMESLGLLAGGVAHDLNNALGILVGYSELLYDGFDESDPMREDVRNIMMGGERAAAIVQDMLNLARRGVQTKTVVNLNKTVTEYLKSPEYLKLTSFHPTVRIKTELDEELLKVVGSAVHLSKALMNLVSNAAEAMPSGGDMVIKTESLYLDRPFSGYDKIEEGDYIVLSVSDTGEGITDDDMKRIFEPFYTKKVMGRSGTGLGLSVVWGTVKDHNGYIDVRSGRGKGTTFILYFPVTHEEMEEDKVTLPDEYMGRGEKILVVDDINVQRDLASRMLTKLNYQVETVASGEDAVEYLKTKEADLIVLDMIMDPGIDGFETYRQISEFRPQTKAVIVSGFAETDRVKMAQSLGAGAFVKKPYIKERIGLAVRKELDKK